MRTTTQCSFGDPNLGSGILQVLNELEKACLERFLSGLGKFDEAEGLEPALSSPHGEHHFYFFADCGFPKMKDQFDLELFVEWFFKVHQAAGGGKLVQFPAYLATIGELNKGQDRSAQFDPKRAVLAARQA